MCRTRLGGLAAVLAVVACASCGSSAGSGVSPGTSTGPTAEAATSSEAPVTTGAPELSAPIAATDQPSTSGPAPAVGLPECRDVPTIAASIVGDDPTAPSLDPVFQGVVDSYVAEHQDTFGGAWMDREANGVFVVAFTDDPVAHRAALAQRRPSPDDVAVMSPPPSIADT